MRVAVAAGVLAGACSLMPSAPADASPADWGCNDNYYPIRYNGALVAKICDSSAWLGQGDITFHSFGEYRGAEKFMKLRVCELGATGPFNCVVDQGTRLYKAGPIPDPGGCQLWQGVMGDGNGNQIVNSTVEICN